MTEGSDGAPGCGDGPRAPLVALADLVAAYEAVHGEITDGELAAQELVDRDAALRARSGVDRAE